MFGKLIQNGVELISGSKFNNYSTVEPLESDTPRDQRNMLDCTGCRNTLVLF